MDLTTDLARLAVRLRERADELDGALERTETDDSYVFSTVPVWRAVAELRESSGVLATLAATGPQAAPELAVDAEFVQQVKAARLTFDDVELRATIREDAEKEFARQLAQALDMSTDPVGDRTGYPLFVDLLDRVRQTVEFESVLADRVLAVQAFVAEVADAAGYGPVDSATALHPVVERVRAQLEERSMMLRRLRDHLGDPNASPADLVDVLGKRQSLVARQAMTATQDAARFALVEVAKALATYAPAFDDPAAMSVDELRTTIVGIAHNAAQDGRRHMQLADERRTALADIAALVGLGRGAAVTEIAARVRTILARPTDEDWPDWADRIAGALGVEAQRDVPWTDEALELVIDRAGELRDLLARVQGDVQVAGDALEAKTRQLADALAPTGTDYSGASWASLVEHARALARRENGRPSMPVPSSVAPMAEPKYPAVPYAGYGTVIPVGPSVDAWTGGGVNRGEPA